MPRLVDADITPHFHWAFWRPFQQCIGGPVYFGFYYEVEFVVDHRNSEACHMFQTAEQHAVKLNYIYRDARR